MLQRIRSWFIDSGLVIPIPIPFIPGLRLRLVRWDLNPNDKRIGVTLQLEWA